MSRESLGLPTDLHSYLLSVSVRETEALQSLREETARHPYANMQIAAEQGAFMSMLVRITGAKRILEVGTFTGYSALSMASALPDDGKLLTLDVNKETGKTAAAMGKCWDSKTMTPSAFCGDIPVEVGGWVNL